MKALTENLARLAPPLWLTSALAVVLGAALLAAFVDLLRENVRRGEEMRQWQRVGTVRQPMGTVANAAQRARSTPLGTSLAQGSPTFQR